MVLVCVTNQENCSRLIYAGRDLATIKDVPLKVICVRPKHEAEWLASDEVEYLLDIAKQQEAEMIVLFANDPTDATVKYIYQHKVNFILTGTPPCPGKSIFIAGLEKNFPHIPLISVDKEGNLQKISSLHTA